MMNAHRTTLRALLAILIATQSMTPPALAANPFEAVLDVMHNTKRRIGMTHPEAVRVPSVERVAGEIDWLEHKVETFGTVVPKQPDVWGEARLTKYRREVEEVLAKRLDQFDATLQGSIRRSDQSFLAAALTMDVAASATGSELAQLNEAQAGAAQAQAEAAAAQAAAAQTIINSTLFPTSPENATDVINRTAPVRDFQFVSLPGEGGAQTPLQISIEPTLFNDQLSRYLKALNQLRRINEGDDTSDSPGYSLNLVRVPVSVLPGKLTRKGYGAELSLTVQPQITDDLLPTTMRSLIVNDVVNLHSSPVALALLKDPESATRAIEAFEQQRPRVSNWMATFDRWLDTLHEASVHDPSNASLTRLVDFYEGNRSYLENRFFQIADAAKAQDNRAPKLTENDFAIVHLVREPTHSATPDWTATIGVTFSDLARWFDAIASEADSYRVQHELKVHAAAGVARAKDLVASAQFKLLGGLKQSADIRDDYEVSSSLPMKFAEIRGNPIVLKGVRGSLSRRQTRSSGADETLVSPQTNDPEEVPVTSFGQQITLALESLNYGNEASIQLDALSVARQINLPVEAFAPVATLSTNSRASRRPIPPSSYLEVMGYQGFQHLVREAHAVLKLQTAALDVSSYLDVRAYLQEETNAAYRWLCDQRYSHLWQLFAAPEIAEAVVDRNYSLLNRRRNEFLAQVGAQTESRLVSSLAWSILVDAALLNARLIDDMQRVSLEKGCTCLTGDHLTFVGPREAISVEAQAAWKEYVTCRWPIQVFALDPVAEDQNVADQFSRRRELQLALAVGVAQGNVRARAATRFARRLETDIETIALNRTAVGFSHGSDTFGWRFYPRLQTPDTPGTLGAMWQTLAGGPDPDADLRDRGLEPGIRECTAIIVMPSFIPHVTFESRASWFGLTNPRRKALTMKDTMKISSNFQAVRRSLTCARESCAYRPGDVAHLSRVVDQIERRLPLQHMRVPVPYENTLGGFEMFDAGITDLAPELHGWYGAPGVVVGVSRTPKTKTVTNETVGKTTVATTVDAEAMTQVPTTTLFLVGSRFSVHETRVVAGGKEVKPTLISREIMQVDIPGNANTVEQKLSNNTTQKYVDVHVSTPYGVTSHLLVKAIDSPSSVAASASARKLAAATKLVEDLDKVVKQVRRDLPGLVASEPTLNLIATPQEDGKLAIAPSLGVSEIEAKFTNRLGDRVSGDVEMVLYDDKGSQLSDRFPTGVPVAFLGDPDTRGVKHPETVTKKLNAADLATRMAEALNGQLAPKDFKNKKKSLRAAMFLYPARPGDSGRREPFLGEIKVEITLNDGATASVGGPTLRVADASIRLLPPPVRSEVRLLPVRQAAAYSPD